jgi:hypothetical protein
MSDPSNHDETLTLSHQAEVRDEALAAAMEDLPANTPEQPGEGTENGPVPVLTAFLCVLGPDGHWRATTDTHIALQLAREASVEDMLHATTIISTDIVSANISANVMQAHRSAAQEMAQRMGMMQAEKQAGVPTGAVDLSALRRG